MSIAPPRMAAAPWPQRRARVAELRAHGPALAAALACAAIVAVVAIVVVAAASAPSPLVRGSQRNFEAWLAGPLRGLAQPMSEQTFSFALIALLVLYTVAVLGSRRLPLGCVAVAVLAAHAVLLLGPPLLAGDVFGYLGYARLGALHGLSPYTHGALALAGDPVHRFVLWRDVVSPYGPGFTLLTYLLVPLGIAGGLWALKAIAVLASLACVALVAATARRAGGSPGRAAALVGLNPLLLLYAVGGAHNDLLLAALTAAALALLAARRGAPAAAVAVLAATVKLSALLLVPFIVLGAAARRRALAAALVCAAACAAGSALAFGASLGGMAHALRQQQQLVSLHSVPGELQAELGGGIGAIRAVLAGVLALAVLAALAWAWRRRASAPAAAGWATLALLLTTAWLVPWYVVWLLPIAAVARDRRLEVATVAVTAFIGIMHLRLGL